MKQYIFASVISILLATPSLKAVDFSVKEKSIIYTNSIKVLQDYETIINQMGEYIINDIEKAKSNAESLLELFVNRQVLIYNDLDPAHRLSEFYEAETYSSNIILWYPDGLSISLDMEKAMVSNIMTHENNVFSIDIMLKKSMNGNYLNQTMNNNIEELTFRIAFGLENKSLNNFKIVGIRNASSNYVIDYDQALKEVNSEDINEEDMLKIQGEIITVIKDYTNFLSLLGDPKEDESDKEFYKASFLNLFHEGDIRVYNDIDPEPANTLISLGDYLTGLAVDYPNGIRNISINTDSVKFGKVMKEEDGSLYTYLDADKFFSGSYKGKDAFRKMFPLIFKISFNSSGNAFTNFLINSIDISSVNFYQANGENQVEQRPDIIIRPVTRKGFGMTLVASIAKTQIDSKDITTLSLETDLHSWDTSPLYGYLTSLGVSYFFNDNLAVVSGLEFNKYSEKFNLTGKFTDNILAEDVNSSSYYRIVEAAFDSLVSINYITLPIGVNYTSGKPGKLGFFVEGGIKVSIPASASYSLSGNYKTSGYYPYNETVLQYLDLQELGFYNREDITEEDKFKMKGFNLAIYSSLGLNIPLGYYSSISFGPEINFGISDIMSDKSVYTDIFGKTYTHQPTIIKNIGIRISLAYKL